MKNAAQRSLRTFYEVVKLYCSGMMMRLSAHEQKMIIYVANQFFGSNARVILFGSRVNDLLRGGDIDLLILPGGPLESPYLKKLAFRSALKNEIGDQKIDVILAAPNDSRQIVRNALLTGVEL
jgi:predicted nucleotidyltransferase